MEASIYKIKVTLILLFIFISSIQIYSQIESETTLFMNNPIHLNPAFTGTNNELAFEIITKQQWIDVKNSPATYMLNIESPINDSKTSIGASLISDWAGPLNSNRILLSYSAIFKLNHAILLSLGLNAGADNYNVFFDKINLVEQEDPAFSNKTESMYQPNVGAGIYLYGASGYIGASVLNMLKSSELKWLNTNLQDETQNILVTGGMDGYISHNSKIKISALAEFMQRRNIYSFAAELINDDYFNIGGTYKLNHSASLVAGIPISEYISINYSYSFPVGATALKLFNTQELSIKFSTDMFYYSNSKREFTRKAQSQDSSLKSIRYF